MADARWSARAGRPSAGLATRRVPLLGLVVLVAVVGCGVSAEREPRAVTPPRGPVPGTSPPMVTEAGELVERLCYVRDDALVMVDRRVRIRPTPREQVGMLLDGPIEAERDAGLSSALTGVGVVTGIQVAGGEATVDVVEGLAGSVRSDEVLAYGQLVCTLTSRDDIDRVSFVQDGEPLGVPRADGSLSTGPLTVTDYASMITSR